MKIALINGSPRVKDSNSACILHDLKPLLSEQELIEFKFNKTVLPIETLEQLTTVDVIVLAFPLYVDSLPSHLLHCLMQIEDYVKEKEHKITVYAIVNSGFYDAIQNKHALQIIKNWCSACHFTYGQGIGLGAGEMLKPLRTVPLGKGPKVTLLPAYESLVNHILLRTSADNLYVSPKFPRWLYRISGMYNWRQMAKANGLKAKDIHTRK